MHPFLNIAVLAARKAGDLIVRHLGRLHEVKVGQKGENDYVSEVDQKAEALIIGIIRRAYPDHAILAEESGAHLGNPKKSTYCWVIDPLDGTTNFLHGYPQFCVSIAVEDRGVLEHAVIYDPLLQEIYTASRGCGARMNDRRLRVSPRVELAGTLLATGFPVRTPAIFDDYLSTFRALSLCTAGIRRAGSAALDLAHVAAGRLDGYWEFRLKRWDIAAGALLVQEAGGRLGNPLGEADFLDTGNILAGSPKIYEAMLAILAGPECMPHTRICMGTSAVVGRGAPPAQSQAQGQNQAQG
jgi:myo-inositol-1(or 4)-monophosphatase